MRARRKCIAICQFSFDPLTDGTRGICLVAIAHARRTVRRMSDAAHQPGDLLRCRDVPRGSDLEGVLKLVSHECHRVCGRHALRVEQHS
jgi:hypothetical protein